MKEKLFRFSSLCLSALLLLAGCSVSPGGSGSVSAGNRSTSAEAVDTSVIKEVYPQTAGGDETIISKDLVVTDIDKLPEQIAEYVDPFPSDDTGLLYEVDDKVKAQMTNNLEEYLDCLFIGKPAEELLPSDPPEQSEVESVMSEVESSDIKKDDSPIISSAQPETDQETGTSFEETSSDNLWADEMSREDKNYQIVPDEEGSYKAKYEDENMMAVSWVTKIRVFTEAYHIADDMGSGDLLQNQLVAAAVKYLGMSAPQIYDETEYTPEGNISRLIYRIVNKGEDLEKSMYNHAFQYITVSRFAGSNSVILEIERKTVDTAPSQKVVSYDAALQYVREKYPEADPDDIQAMVTYINRVKPGRYVPCYKFNVEMKDSLGQLTSNIIYIDMQE